VTVSARNETTEEVDLDAVVDLVDGVVAAEGAGGEVSVLLVGSEAIRRLNREHRGRDAVTDVLAFPLDDPADDLDGVPRMLGDVVVCLERARAQADDLGHSPGEELSALLTHGTLHLLGYDHEPDADDGAMLVRQDDLLGRLPTIGWAG
jgi:probable rRNA maturation factor